MNRNSKEIYWIKKKYYNSKTRKKTRITKNTRILNGHICTLLLGVVCYCVAYEIMTWIIFELGSHSKVPLLAVFWLMRPVLQWMVTPQRSYFLLLVWGFCNIDNCDVLPIWYSDWDSVDLFSLGNDLPCSLYIYIYEFHWADVQPSVFNSASFWWQTSSASLAITSVALTQLRWEGGGGGYCHSQYKPLTIILFIIL